MPRWRFTDAEPISFNPAESPSNPVTLHWGRRWQLASDDREAHVGVVADLAVTTAVSWLASDAQDALATNGKTAVEQYLDAEDLPAELEITTTGVVVRR